MRSFLKFSHHNLMRYSLASFLFAFCVSFLSCSSPTYNYNHIKVTEVIDGDTVRLADGNLVRYIGVDTPEVRIREDGKFVYSPQPFALQAKEFNRRLVEGKFVRVEFDVGKTDKYGRLLGYCFQGDKFINAELIKEGYAVVYTWPPNVKYADLFYNLQKEARENKKGLWGSYDVIPSEEASRYINQIRTVRGRVVNTYRSEKVVYLNFGNDYRRDFTVVIFRNSWNQFRNAGIDPVVFYSGKTVEVTGRIRSYNGPEIIVSSPREIRILD